MESAHRGRMPAEQASSSGSVAPHQRDVARACERTCGVPCNLRVARLQQATQQNAAVEGAVGIAHEEATEWGRGMDYHASTVAAIAAAHEAVAARIRGEVAATAEEARLTQEAIACKEAEVKALEEALAQERAMKEEEERAHAEATAKAQADAAKKDAIEAARRKVAEERAKTEAELAVLEVGRVGIFGSSGCLLWHCRKKVLPRGRPVPPTALCQVLLEPLPHVLGKALSRPPGPCVPGGRVSPHVSMGRATCPLLWAAALGGCPAVWSISHHKGYCSRLSTVRPPHPCGLSCGATLLGG